MARRAKALTGVDDHSRFCVSAYLMVRESSQRVCDGLASAMRTYGVPGADPDRQRQGVHRPVQPATGRGALRPDLPGERHRAPATQPRSPTTTGKVERFHRAIRTEFRTDRVFADLATAQAELDEWVTDYNTDDPTRHSDMATPAERFLRTPTAPVDPAATPRPDPAPGRGPRRRDLGGPTGQHGRRGVRELAAGLPRASPPPAATSTCGSPTTSCSSTTATSCSRTEKRTTPEEVRVKNDPRRPKGALR